MATSPRIVAETLSFTSIQSFPKPSGLEVENLLGRIEYWRLFLMTTGWRIVLAERAIDAFSGEGAKIYGGRWNSPGHVAVYGSEQKSLAVLEQLVHLNPRFLPKNWRQQPPPASTQEAGDT